jgi:voltage-gated potassium channel
VSEAEVMETRRISRREMLRTAALSIACAGAALALYYGVPLLRTPHSPVWWRLLIALAIFGAVVSHELGSIMRHSEPMRRAVVALSLLLPLFVVTFSWIYLTMSRSNPASFGTPLSRSSALYFTVTVMSTVGFGDIVPKTDPARLVTAVQMVSDLIFLAVGVRLIFDVASRAAAKRREPTSSDHG